MFLATRGVTRLLAVAVANKFTVRTSNLRLNHLSYANCKRARYVVSEKDTSSLVKMKNKNPTNMNYSVDTLSLA